MQCLGAQVVDSLLQNIPLFLRVDHCSSDSIIQDNRSMPPPELVEAYCAQELEFQFINVLNI